MFHSLHPLQQVQLQAAGSAREAVRCRRPVFGHSGVLQPRTGLVDLCIIIARPAG